MMQGHLTPTPTTSEPRKHSSRLLLFLSGESDFSISVVFHVFIYHCPRQTQGAGVAPKTSRLTPPFTVENVMSFRAKRSPSESISGGNVANQTPSDKENKQRTLAVLPLHVKAADFRSAMTQVEQY